MSCNVLVSKSQCRNKDLATIAWLFCPHYGSVNLILPEEEYQRLTSRHKANKGNCISIGHVKIKLVSELQTRFENVLDKISNFKSKGI